jgi:hypothetical protein
VKPGSGKAGAISRGCDSMRVSRHLGPTSIHGHDALTRDTVRAPVSEHRPTSTRSHIGPGGLALTLQC